MTDIVYPRESLPPRIVTPEVVPATMGGGRGITAIDQIILADAGYWQILLDQIPFASRVHKILWRAMAAQAMGRENTILVPIYDTDGTPWPFDAAGKPIKAYKPVRHSDDTFFSDGAGYQQPVISATISAAATAGDMQVSISIANSDVLQPGQHFSVLGLSGKTRLYRISRIISAVNQLTDDDGNVLTDDDGNILTPDASQYVVRVNLPLREDIIAGTAAEFDDPRLTCRLATDREMDTGADDYAGRTTAKITFVESLP